MVQFLDEVWTAWGTSIYHVVFSAPSMGEQGNFEIPCQIQQYDINMPAIKNFFRVSLQLSLNLVPFLETTDSTLWVQRVASD